MLRDNLVGLIEPMLSGAGAYPLALRTNRKPSSDDRPACLENPRPAGAESTLTENVASPFHAEPGQICNPDHFGNLATGSLLQRQCLGSGQVDPPLASPKPPLGRAFQPYSRGLPPDRYTGFQTPQATFCKPRSRPTSNKSPFQTVHPS